MTWFASLLRYKWIIGIGLALSLIIGVWLYGENKHKDGFNKGRVEGILACKSASDTAEAASTKVTKDIIKATRTSSYSDDIDWLKSNGLLRE